MKRSWFILLIFCCLVEIASASIEIHNYTFETIYSSGEKISGEINLTISGEDYDLELISGDGNSISLGDFLTANGVIYQCSPADCSKNYNTSSASTDKTFNINSEPLYGGFALNGTDIIVTNLNFSIESDFGVSTMEPLFIEFFEEGIWRFSKFSNVFSSKIWGCYGSNVPSQGPLIGTSSYCEMISISETGTLNIGAYVEINDDKDLNMKIYPEEGGSYLGECSYNPSFKVHDGCRIDAEEGEIFEAGNYQVCVSSDSLTNYHIYEEYSKPNCGFVYSIGPENSDKDYAIFARTAKYSDANSLSSKDIDLVGATSIADNLLERRYHRDCSGRCILPLTFSGVPQTLRIYDVVLQYTKNGENYQEEEIYNLNPIPAIVDFSGVLDLSLTEFNVSESGSYSLYLGDKKLLEENIEKLPTPIIGLLSPSNPPAGVPIIYYVNIDYDTPNASLIYKWDFGNGHYETTTENFVVHTFTEIKNYTINLKVSADGNLTSKKSFIINTINPIEAVNATLFKKDEALNNTIKKIDDFPQWYQKALKKIIDVSFYKEELNRLKKARSNAIEDADFLAIAKDLYSLDIPTNIFANKEIYPFLLTRIDNINPETIANIGGSSNYENFEEYKNPILNWQTQNIKGSYSTEIFSVSKWNGEVVPIFRTYSFNINSSDDYESYFVINRPREEVYFNELAGARKTNNATVIIFNRGETKSFKFYSEDSDETTFFISPKLSAIVIEADIDTTCNFNNICEKNLGENPNTCRSDCKPIASAIIYVILAIILVLIIYTILQIWYERRYENHLFRDRRELYNIIMYITNARARDQMDGMIIATLRKQGWSGEKIIYVIKKSRGQRTGMFEVIPINKITAWFRNRKAKKKIATAPQQQNRRNINKSMFQKRI